MIIEYNMNPSNFYNISRADLKEMSFSDLKYVYESLKNHQKYIQQKFTINKNETDDEIIKKKYEYRIYDKVMRKLIEIKGEINYRKILYLNNDIKILSDFVNDLDL